MKKTLLLLLLLFPVIINADEKTIFSINEVTASPGNNVTVNINIKNKQKFGVLTARIHFDNSKIEYVSSELKGLKNGTIKGIDDNNEKGLVAIYGITLSQKKLMSDNGDIVTIEFHIKDNVESDIPLELEIVDFGVDETKSLDYEKKDGIVHIKNNVETVPKNAEQSIEKKYKEENKNENVEEDITWSSTDEKIATVDKEGNVVFNGNGNVTIEAKDKNGNVIYSKDYFVKDKISKKKSFIIIFPVVIIIVIFLLIRRRKCKKRKLSIS